MSVPYLGSKRKSAPQIYQTIKNLNPNSSILVDLFCGGFAVSKFFLENGFSVIANDKNKYVISLLKKAIFEGLDEKKVLEFVSRDKFFDVLTNKNKYEHWYVGYVMCIWSFGNNQSGYLFGKNVEQYKKAGHELVINKNFSLIKKLIPNIPQKYIDGIISLNNWHKRRIALSQVSHKLKTRILELQQLQRLEQLEQLERLERLKLYNCDYRDIIIPSGAIIYCDPPYEGTAEYAEGNFNHTDFWEWVRKISRTNKVYVSEYIAPKDFKSVLRFSRNSTLQGGNNKNQSNENLYVFNKKIKWEDAPKE